MDYDKLKIFKWIGGKGWLSETLNFQVKEILKKNRNIDTYIEPFCGSLGSFLVLEKTLKEFNIKNIYLNDVNKTIINLFLNLRDLNKRDLIIEEYIKLETHYNSLIPEDILNLNKTKDKDIVKKFLENCNNFYLLKRKLFNSMEDTNIDKLVLFLFLTNHNFNGIWRENSKGEMNSPFNWDNKKVNLNSKIEKLNNFSQFLMSRNIIFTNFSYEVFFKELNKNDFLQNNKNNFLFYFDPPYMNIDGNENKYSKDSFKENEQLELIECIKNNTLHFLYSNHPTNSILEKFTLLFKNKFKIEFLNRKNIISADVNSRKIDKQEILISSNKDKNEEF